jgi:hypothetical protein
MALALKCWKDSRQVKSMGSTAAPGGVDGAPHQSMIDLIRSLAMAFIERMTRGNPLKKDTAEGGGATFSL